MSFPLCGIATAENTHKNHTDIINQIRKINKEQRWLSIYQKCIDYKTGLPSLIMRKACDILNLRMNHILTKITDFTVEFKYDKEFIINTIERGCSIPADMGSGFQKFILDIIMRIVLTNITSCGNPSLIFIDEGFGCLDKENFSNVAGILNILKHNFKAMIIITHIDELKEHATKVIKIEKSGMDSVLKYGTEPAPRPPTDASGPDEVKLYEQTPPTSVRHFAASEDAMEMIEILGNMYNCKACGGKPKKYSYTAVAKHLNGKSFAAKHQKYLEKNRI